MIGVALRRWAATGWAVFFLLFGRTAHADLSPAERATAEALFQQGVLLMESGEFAQACNKFAGTLELEQGTGTMLRLADCYDRLGKTASSWALFREVAARAALGNDMVRAQIAGERAEDLESRLSLVKLTITPDNSVETSSTVGSTAEAKSPALHIELAGTVIPRAMWDSSFPVDPGSQPIKVSGEGLEPWVSTVLVPPGPALTSVVVPALLPPGPKPQAAFDAFAGRTHAEQPAVERALTKPPPSTVTPATDTGKRSSLRPWGYFFTAFGILGMAASGYLAYQAYALNQSSLAQCQPGEPNACTPRGVSLREDAQSFATAATITGAASGVLTAGGLSIVLFAPGAPSPSRQGSVPLSLGLSGQW